MKNKALCISIMLAAGALLSACGLSEYLPDLSQLRPGHTAAPVQEPAESAGGTVITDPATPAAAVVLSDSRYGTLIHIDRTERVVLDPAQGKQKILTYAWDSVKVSTPDYPDAGVRMTEEMAALQDIWYTGSGSTGGDIYGYNTMLEAAEDRFALTQEYGGQAACMATRYVTVERADSSVCVFQVNTITDLGGGERSSSSEQICFDARTGERLSALADDPQRQPASVGSVKLLPLAKLPEGEFEIADRIVIGEGGDALILLAEGEVRDLSLWSLQYTDRFYLDAELFFCGRLRDCALQLALMTPGDLPNTLLRYRDAAGVHDYLIGISGENGEYILTENQ